MGNISVPTQRHTNFDSEALDEENSAFDFDALHRSQASKTERLYREKQAVIFGNNRSSFLSRKDLLQYTKSIPTKVKATISLNERSEDYIKKFHEISKKTNPEKKTCTIGKLQLGKKRHKKQRTPLSFPTVDYFARSSSMK